MVDELSDSMYHNRVPRRDLNQKVAVAVVYVVAMFMAILDSNYHQ
jgi:hypothetical protein